VRDILNSAGRAYLRVGSTLAYAPSDDPQIAVIIIVDQPQCKIIYGSYVAAPYIGSFLSQALPYIGVERSYTEAELANLSVSLRDYVGLTVSDASTDLTGRGIDFEIKGKGDTVTYQVPDGGSSINKSTGKVILYSGDEKPDTYIKVPSVIGKTAYQSNRDIINAGLNILLDGSSVVSASEGAVAVSQVPAAGTSVEYGTVVTVTMRYLGDGAD
jgi:stage V sporulation protein D (sporulation-specific penicillin-binding protein)